MIRRLIIVIFLGCLALVSYAQNRPTIAILPFTGGSIEDGETIPELFSFDQTLNSVFSPMPRTSINSAIRQEQSFQMSSGMTNPETISRIGRQLGARYVVAGTITNLGDQHLLVISIMQIENLQMVAGEWIKYTEIGEIQEKIPQLAQVIVELYRRDISQLQKIAVLPFQTTRGDREADALAQIFAVEVVRSGTYAVFPRTQTLEQVQTEYRNQLDGRTADEYTIRIGRGENPLLALSGAVRSLGANRRMFNASIINVESGVQLKGDSVNYNAIEEAVESIWYLAAKLTGQEFIVRYPYELSAALRNINGSNNNTINGNFIITLSGNIDPTALRFLTNGRKLIIIRGDNIERTITSGLGSLIEIPAGITLVLENNIQLHGGNREQSIIRILNGGTLRMEAGVTITGAKRPAISVGTNSIFIMNGGTITGNSNTANHQWGAGVIIYGGLFIMNDGVISRNTSGTGAGVYIANGTFIMNGGVINNNRAEQYQFQRQSYGGSGGGVYINSSYLPHISDLWCLFIKTGGTISNNSSSGSGYQVFEGSSRRFRNRALGPNDNVDNRERGDAGWWNQ